MVKIVTVAKSNGSNVEIAKNMNKLLKSQQLKVMDKWLRLLKNGEIYVEIKITLVQVNWKL